jgi:hypothetical protein
MPSIKQSSTEEWVQVTQTAPAVRRGDALAPQGAVIRKLLWFVSLCLSTHDLIASCVELAI